MVDDRNVGSVGVENSLLSRSAAVDELDVEPACEGLLNAEPHRRVLLGQDHTDHATWGSGQSMSDRESPSTRWLVTGNRERPVARATQRLTVRLHRSRWRGGSHFLFLWLVVGNLGTSVRLVAVNMLSERLASAIGT